MSAGDTSDPRVLLLMSAVREFHWMARRYCDGRMSTAPNAFNDITRKLLAAGISLSDPLFARDGMGRRYDGLTDAEAEAAEADMPYRTASAIRARDEKGNGQ